MRLRLLAAAALALGARAAVSVVVDGVRATAPRVYPRASVGAIQLSAGAAVFSLRSSAQAYSATVNGSELLAGATGASSYVDAAGNNGMNPTLFRVWRVNSTFADVGFVDNTSSPLQYELHHILRDGHSALYSYVVVTAVRAAFVSELRHVTRWNRCKLPWAFTAERSDVIPHGELLGVSPVVQDSTWLIETGVNNASLACPATNAGTLPRACTWCAYPYVYTKYAYSIYYSQNPFFGHHGTDRGMAVGTFVTPLMGVTDRTSAATYGGGPLHQDLAVHQDSLIANYLHRNHYGSSGETFTPGQRRLFGPWANFLLAVPGTGASSTSALLAAAGAYAQAEIAASIPGVPWVAHELYAPPAQRVTVTGQLVNANAAAGDSRPLDRLWVLLTPEGGNDNHPTDINAPTYYVRTAANGSFAIPGIAPGNWSLYVFPAGGAMMGVGRWDGVNITRTGPGAVCSLGELAYAPQWRRTFLLSVGASDGEGGEFALGNHTREFDLPTRVPADLTFAIGRDWEPADWFYAQTKGGTWSVEFTLSAVPAGTVHVTMGSSLQQWYSPTLAVNGQGSAALVVGAPPTSTDSTLSRQAVRSGMPRVGGYRFPASLLRAGRNVLDFTRIGGGRGPNIGMGWDVLLVEAEGDTALPPEQQPVLAVAGAGARLAGGAANTSVWHLRVTAGSQGASTAPARQVQLEGVALLNASTGRPLLDAPVALAGRDPSRFAVPVVEELAPGGSAPLTFQMTAALPCGATAADAGALALQLRLAANGRRVVLATALPYVCGSPSPTPSPTRSASATYSSSATLTPLRADTGGGGGVCPAAGMRVVGGRCFGALPLAAPANTWSSGQVACASLAPGGRLAHILGPADGAFVARSLCGVVASTGWVAIGLTDPSDTAGTNRSCCWAWATPVLGEPRVLADGTTANVVALDTAPASFLRSPEGQAFWRANQPSGGGGRTCTAILKTSGNDPFQGVDDGACSGGYSHACCEAPLQQLSPTASPAATSTASGSGTPSGTVSATLSGTPSATSSGTRSRSPTGTCTRSATASRSPAPTASGTSSATPSASATGSTTPVSGSASARASRSLTASASETKTATLSGAPTRSASGTVSGTRSGSAAGTPTPSASVTGASTSSSSVTGTPAPTGTPSPSSSPSQTGSPSASASPSVSPPATPTPPATHSGTGSKTPAPSRSRSGSATRSRAAVAGSRSPSATRSRSRSRSASRSRTATPSRSRKAKR